MTNKEKIMHNSLKSLNNATFRIKCIAKQKYLLYTLRKENFVGSPRDTPGDFSECL